MIYYLRNEKNQTLFDLEFWTEEQEGHTFHEISATVCIKEYSEFLLSQPAEKQQMIIALFDQLSEYRGWLWENYYMAKRNTGDDEDYEKIRQHLDRMFTGLAEHWGFKYVID